MLKDNPDEFRRRIGMVFQHFNLFPHKSVLENISLALRKIRQLDPDQAPRLGETRPRGTEPQGRGPTGQPCPAASSARRDRPCAGDGA